MIKLVSLAESYFEKPAYETITNIGWLGWLNAMMSIPAVHIGDDGYIYFVE